MVRIYWETVKKWAIRVGITGASGFALLFIYLSFLGVIEVTGYSGDMICDGTIEDPCLAFVNFTAKEDIFIYPVGYDPWGRDTPFYTDKGLKSWKIYRSWGKGWREIKLNKTCTGTWCGAPNNLGVKYSFVFRKGRDYQIRIVALKEDTNQNIKWGFGPVDPVWYSISNRTHVNDLRSKDINRLSNGKLNEDLAYQSYDSFTKELLIEDKFHNLIIKMRLTSPYSVSGLIASPDTKVADFYLEDWKDEKTNLVDSINFYDAKDSYKSRLDKNYRFKYGTDYEECLGKYCYNYTIWTEFETLNELPHKNIKISLWANTESLEKTEWVFTINGFKILQWAEWDISTASYTGNHFSVNTQIPIPTGVFFKPDGTKMYVSEYVGNNAIAEYDLSVAWNVTTSSFLQEYSVVAQDISPQDLFFKSDGTKMYFVSYNSDTVFEYNLSTTWDVSSATYTGNSFLVSGQENRPAGLFFKSDGTRMFISGRSDAGNAPEVNSYTLSTAWDVTTASFDSKTKDVSSQDSKPTQVFFKSDGTKMYFMGDDNNAVFEYNLSTTWDVTTASYNQSFGVGSQESAPEGLFFKSSGTKMYAVGTAADTVFEYDLPAIPVVECTPTLNEDWVISDAQICDAKDVTTGTGQINITSLGNLTLINFANVTTTKLNIVGTGDKVFINPGCEIRS